ncbi:MAG: hypothetical protein EBQ92_12000, partial [Proteobacteria bacterium]|nr:hypothetical protein [Pseudomonadota bacterium]
MRRIAYYLATVGAAKDFWSTTHHVERGYRVTRSSTTATAKINGLLPSRALAMRMMNQGLDRENEGEPEIWRVFRLMYDCSSN